MSNTFYIVFWTVAHLATATLSIVLLGNREMISGDLMKSQKMVMLLTHSRFILSMGLAVAARLTFVMINNALLKNTHLSQSSTSITTIISQLTMVFVVIANVFFLGEKITPSQGAGIVLIVAGLLLVLK